MAKGIEDMVNKQTQLGFLQKVKKRLSHKALTYGLAFSLLFPFARMASADTIYQKTHELEFSLPGAIHGEKRPTTKLEVKADCDKITEKEHELKLSFFAEDWDTSKNNISDYILINNALSNFYLVYPSDVAVGELKESAYLLPRKRRNEKIKGQWKDLVPLELSPGTELKLGLIKIGTKIVSSCLGFLFGGPLGAGAGFVSSYSDEAVSVWEAKRKAMLVNAYGGSVEKIPFYPADNETSARTFTIPIEVKDQMEKETELIMVLDVGLKRGSINNEEYGQLKDLLIKVPLKESVNYNTDEEEPEKPGKGVEEEKEQTAEKTEDIAEKLKQQIEQTIKKEGSLEVKAATEPAKGTLERKVILDDNTPFYIPISVPQDKDELKVTFSRKEDSKIEATARLYYPGGEKACESGLYAHPTKTLNIGSPHAGKYILEIKSGGIQQIDVSSNCLIEEPKYHVDGSVKGGEIMFYAIDVNETNSAEPLLCRIDWENAGHPLSVETYDPSSPSSKSNSPKGLSDISICKTSPTAGKWILAIKGRFAEGGLEKFILQSYNHKIQGLRYEKRQEFIYDETTFSYNQQKDGNFLVLLAHPKICGGKIQLSFPNGKEAWKDWLSYAGYPHFSDFFVKTSYFPFAPAGEYKLNVKLGEENRRGEPQLTSVYFVSSQNAYPIENKEKKN